MVYLEGWVWGARLDVGKVGRVFTKMTEAKEPKSNREVTPDPSLLHQAWGT